MYLGTMSVIVTKSDAASPDEAPTACPPTAHSSVPLSATIACATAPGHDRPATDVDVDLATLRIAGLSTGELGEPGHEQVAVVEQVVGGRRGRRDLGVERADLGRQPVRLGCQRCDAVDGAGPDAGDVGGGRLQCRDERRGPLQQLRAGGEASRVVGHVGPRTRELVQLVGEADIGRLGEQALEARQRGTRQTRRKRSNPAHAPPGPPAGRRTTRETPMTSTP